MTSSTCCRASVFALAFTGLLACAQSAQTTSEPIMRKTQLVVKLATDEPLTVRSRFEDRPPTIVVEFPKGRVVGTLPERSVISRGVIQAIQTSYAAPGSSTASRWIQSLRIRLRGAYDYEVRTEPGRVVVDIVHPASLGGEDVQLGVAGGIEVSSATSQAFSERFRAMQEALARAQPQLDVWPAGLPPDDGVVIQPQAVPMRTGLSAPPASASTAASPIDAPAQDAEPAAGSSPWSGWWGVLAGVVALGVGGLAWWRQRRRARASRLAHSGGPAPVPSGIRLIDQLVWRAIERQGYQLIQLVELSEPPGLMRLITKAGERRAALLCLGNGEFFEKTVVEQFLQAMRGSQAEQGFLVVPGSFTIPAQRYAKEHEIALIGREQLVELLSEGAMSEAAAKQLQHVRTQLEDTTETLAQYTRQLDTFRRQRNEASWYLGEERAKNAKLEAQLGELNQLVSHWQTQAEQWQQTAEASRKQGEENQWYLGEAQASLAHLEEQLRLLDEAHAQLQARHQEAAAALQDAQRQRDEANWYLGESRAAQDALRGQISQLDAQRQEIQKAADDLHRRLEAEQVHRQIVESQLSAVRANGERRRAPRRSRADLTVEVHRGPDDLVFRGIPRDISSTGFGLSADQPLNDLPSPLHIRFYVPDAERPLEATGRLVWHRQDAATNRTLGGCELIDMLADARERLERALAASA